jgi:membrane-associated phospholipid phosphatase
MDAPQRRKAVDGPTATALAEAFRAFELDPDAAVALLHGEGGHLCAGADPEAVGTRRINRTHPDGDGPVGPTRMRLSKPVIAAVEDHAVAGGLRRAPPAPRVSAGSTLTPSGPGTGSVVKSQPAQQTGGMRWGERGPAVRSLVTVGLLALLVMAVLGMVVAGHRGDVALDAPGSPMIALFAGHRSSAVVLAELGGPESIGLLVVALAVALLVRGRRSAAVLVVLAPAAAGALTELVLKPIVGRTLDDTVAFPSGHATGTWALAAAVVVLLADSRLVRRVWLVDSVVVVAIATVNSVALVGAQFHVFTDVVGGAGVGIGVACLFAAALSRPPATVPRPSAPCSAT